MESLAGVSKDGYDEYMIQFNGGRSPNEKVTVEIIFPHVTAKQGRTQILPTSGQKASSSSSLQPSFTNNHLLCSFPSLPLKCALHEGSTCHISWRNGEQTASSQWYSYIPIPHHAANISPVLPNSELNSVGDAYEASV